MTSRLTDDNLKVLKSGGSYVVGSTDFWNKPIFGSMAESDFVEIHVYDLNDNLIKSGKISDFEVGSSGNVILKPGDSLRTMGFISGEYKVVYNFFRDIAGTDDFVLVDTRKDNSGVVYTGPPSYTGFNEKDYWVNSDGVIFKGQEGDTASPEELDIRELKYFVQEISPSRTEVRLAPLDIKLDKYKDDFANLYIDSATYVPKITDDGGQLRLQNSSTFEFTIDKYTSGDSKVNSNMIGGLLRIEDAFITDYTTSQTSITVADSSKLETVFDWNPTDQDWDSSLHIDAVRPEGRWSYGYQRWVTNPSVGYHPMWVENEGKNNSLAIKFIDDNSAYSLEHRQMSVFKDEESLASKGISHKDIIQIMWNQKANSSKYLRMRVKYKTLVSEEKPTEPPIGFIPDNTEPVPTSPPEGFSFDDGAPNTQTTQPTTTTTSGGGGDFGGS